MSVLRKLFGVSWKTHRAQRARIAELDEKAAELDEMLEHTRGLYDGERKRISACNQEKTRLEEERDTLVEINRGLAKELYRVRELFMVVFTSKRARELVLKNRDVHLKHLRKVTGGHKFTVKHVTAAMTIAKREEVAANDENKD